MGVAALAESPDGVVPRPKRPQTVSGDPTEPQFGNPDLARRLAAQGVDPSLIEALCGPIAAAGALKELGVAADPAALAAWGQQNGEWGAEGMARGGGGGMQAMLKSRGVDSEVLPPDAVQQAEAGVEAGKPVIINFAGHYLLATDYNAQTGQWYVGNTGANALKGGSAWMTLGEMAAAPGTKHELRAFIVPTSAAGASPQQGTPSEASAGVAPPTTTSGAVMGAMDRQGDIRSFVRQRAQAYGIDPNTAEAVVGSEGGFDDWARQSDYVNNGVREPSYGPLQLYMNGGLGNTFMAETGLDPRDPRNGPAATDWALRYASQHGWGDWHGAQRIGLGNYEGIGATTPTGTPLDRNAFDASRYAGHASDSPFAPAETPYTPPVERSTGGVDASTRNVYDPLVPVRASLDRTGQALSDFGQGALNYLSTGDLTPEQIAASDAERQAQQDRMGFGAYGEDVTAGGIPTGRPAATVGTMVEPLARAAYGVANPALGVGQAARALVGQDAGAALDTLGRAATTPLFESDPGERYVAPGITDASPLTKAQRLLEMAGAPREAVQAALGSGYYPGGAVQAAQDAHGYQRVFKGMGADDDTAALLAFGALNVLDPTMWAGGGAIGRGVEAVGGARAVAATVLLNGTLGGVLGALQAPTPEQRPAYAAVGAASLGLISLATLTSHAPHVAREIAQAVPAAVADPAELNVIRGALQRALPDAHPQYVESLAQSAARKVAGLRPDLRRQIMTAYEHGVAGGAEPAPVTDRGGILEVPPQTEAGTARQSPAESSPPGALPFIHPEHTTARGIPGPFGYRGETYVPSTAESGHIPRAQARAAWRTREYIAPEDVATTLGKYPAYLDDVTTFLLEQRQEVRDRGFNPRKLAKAYVATLASQRMGEVSLDAVRAKVPWIDWLQQSKADPELTLRDLYAEQRPDGSWWVRPEAIAYAAFETPFGQRLLGDIERGIYTPADWERFASFRDFGANTVLANGISGVEGRQVNLTNLGSFVADLNAVRDDPVALERELKRLKGIGNGKSPFFGFLMGFGELPTVDAREVAYWMSGNMRTSNLTRYRDAGQRYLAGEVAYHAGNADDLGQLVRRDILDSFRRVTERTGLGRDLPSEAYGAVMHHWLWDRSFGTETPHRGEMLAQATLGRGVGAVGGGAVGYAAPADTPEDRWRHALIGAAVGGGLDAGAGALSRGLTHTAPELAGLGEGFRGVASDPVRGPLEERALARMRQGDVAAGGGATDATPPAVQAARDAARSPQAQDLIRAYDEVTPQRAVELKERALSIATNAIAGPGGRTYQATRQLLEDAWQAGLGRMADTKVVATNMDGPRLLALAREGWWSNKLTAFPTREAIGARTAANVGKKRLRPGEGVDFALREGEADRMALGTTQLPDEAGVRDPNAINRVYAYVTNGAPMIGDMKQAIWLVMEDDAPRVATVHHHYGLASPGAAIHVKNTPPGLKAAMWNPDAVRGGQQATGEFGQRVVGWEGAGIPTGGGRVIADTSQLVGGAGEDAQRMANLILGNTNQIKGWVKKGIVQTGDDLAAALMRESTSHVQPIKDAAGAVTGTRTAPPQVLADLRAKAATLAKKGETLSAQDREVLDTGRGYFLTREEHAANQTGYQVNRARMEALLIDPNLGDVKAIYLAGRPADLARKVPNSGGATVLDLAREVRARAQQEFGKDIPILFNDLTPTLQDGRLVPPQRLISGAQVLEGPPTTLAPGRGALRDAYTALTDTAGKPAFVDIGARGVGTVAGGVIGAAAPADTPEERLKHAAIGAGIGLGLDVGAGAVSRRMAGARAAAIVKTPAMRKMDAAFTSKGYEVPQGPLLVRAAQSWSDDLKALKAMQNRVQEALGGVIPEVRKGYDKARLSRAVQGKVEARFEEIGSILRPVKRDIDAVRTAWYAERLKELQGRFDPSMQGTYELPNHLTPADIDQAVLDTQQALGPARWAAVQDAIKGLRGIYERQIDRMVETGMMTAAQRDALRASNQFYAPMRRASWIADHVLDQGLGLGRKDVFSVADNGLRALSETGSTRKVLDPFISMERDVARTESMLLRNDVARTVHGWEPELPGFFKEIPDGTPVPPGWGTFSYIKDGQKVRVGAEKWFTDAMTNLTPAQAGLVGKLLRTAALPLRLGAVALNYGFALFNTPRDFQAALVNQGLMPHWLAYGLASAINARLVPRALRNEGMWKTYLDYLESGAGMSGVYETVGRPGASLRRAAGIPSAGERAMDVLRLPITALRTPGEISELMTRIGTFAQKRARGQSMQSAAMASREGSFDMQKAGTAMRAISQAVPFINARQQSTITTLTRLRDDPATRLRFLLFSALPAIALLAYNTRDEISRKLYDDVPDYEKRDFHVVVVGQGKNEDGSPSPLRVVMPKDNSQKVAGAVTEGLYQALIRHDPHAWAAMAAELAGDVVPTGTVDPIEAGMQLMPPPVRAGAEWVANYDYYRRRPIVPQGQQDLEKVAPDLAFGPRTTEAAKALGRQFHASPRKIEQFAQTFSGGFGKQALEATDTAGRVLRGEAIIPPGGGIPLANKFVRDYGGQIAQDQADAYHAEVQRRVDAARAQLEATPEYRAADTAGKASLVNRVTARIESDTKAQLGPANLPTFLETPQPAGPAKYDVRILPPELRARYANDPYQLQRDIAAAQDVVAAYTRDPRRNRRPTKDEQQLAARAQYVSPEWARWRRTQRPVEDQTRRTIEGVATATR